MYDQGKQYKQGEDSVIMVTSINNKTGEVSKKVALSLQNNTPHKLHQCYAPRIPPTGEGKCPHRSL